MKIHALITALAVVTSAVAVPSQQSAGNSLTTKRGDMLGGLGNLLGMGGSKPAPAPAPQPAPQPGGGYGYGYDYSHAIEELIKAIDALEAGEVSQDELIKNKFAALFLKYDELVKKDQLLDIKDAALDKKDQALDVKDKALDAKDQALVIKDKALDAKDEELEKRLCAVEKLLEETYGYHY